MSEATSVSLLSAMRPEAARERISTFSEQFGLAHLYFAQHAAFPMALTSDLLYRLWANFQRDIYGKKLNIPWMAVADVLLSSFCEEVGFELYEMDIMVRAELLNALKANPRFSRQRINELSHFLLDYVRQQLHSSNPGIRILAQTQRWTALAYVQPGRVARELTETLKVLDQQNKVELIRFVSLMETLGTLAEPLAALEGFIPLLIYARRVRRAASDNVEDAKAQSSSMQEDEQIGQAVEVNVSTSEQLQKTDLDFNAIITPLMPYIYETARKYVPRPSDSIELWQMDIEEIVQGTLIQIWNALQRNPITNFEAYIRAFIRNQATDLARRRRRESPLHLEIEEDDKEYQDSALPRSLIAGSYLVDVDDREDLEKAVEVAIENIYQEDLFFKLAQEISRFPEKQRTALLIDLANRMDFGEQPTPLQQAFLLTGIQLKDYQRPLPDDRQDRARYASLLSTAYRRLRNAIRPQEDIF